MTGETKASGTSNALLPPGVLLVRLAFLNDDMRVSSPLDNPMRRNRVVMILTGALAAGLLLLSYFMTGENWAQIFQTDLANPDQVSPPRSTAFQGGTLLRIMLLVLGLGFLVIPQLLSRLHTATGKKIDRNDYSSGELWLLGALIVGGLAFRLSRFTESLWYDEIAAWVDYGIRGPGWIVGTYYDPANHIAHTLLSWCSVQLMGGDAFALRFVALIFSLGSIVALYGLARCIAGPRCALYAGLLTAILPVSILEGIEARGYSMMIFFAALATWLLLSVRRDQKTWKWIAYSCVCGLGIWSHLTTVFVPLGHGLWLGWCALQRKERRFALCGFLALGLGAMITLTLYAPVLPQMLSIRSTFQAIDGNEPGLLGPEGLHALLQFGGSWTLLSAVPGLLLFVVGLMTSRDSPGARTGLALSLLGVPLLVCSVVIGGSWMYARFVLFALPGTILAMSLGIAAFSRHSRLLGVLAVVLLMAASAEDLFSRPPKQPLRDAAMYVSKSIQPGERVLVIGLAHRVMDMYAGEMEMYYSLQHGVNLPEALTRVEPTWIILMYPNHVSEERYALLDNSGFSQTTRFQGWVDWGNGDIIIYRK